ncbi:MAG TPA: SMP-30/gluconolactonase/LRE family protein, partial [Anaeromyxobacteraceae bacterium]|nr:SMP-30/gluconolactonase/LRE family protein [Anaeromyxobacteraceae bacterium]
MPTAQLLLDCRSAHGEGIFWDPRVGRAFWTGLAGQRLWSYDPAAGTSEAWPLAERLCCFAPWARGGFVASFAGGVALLEGRPPSRPSPRCSGSTPMGPSPSSS